MATSKIMKYLLNVVLTALLVLPVMQSCKDPYEGTILFKVSQDNFSVGHQGGALVLTISSPSTWSISSDSPWLNISPTGGSQGISNKVTMNVAPNTSEGHRTGHLTVKATSKNEPILVTVTQNGTDGGPVSDVNEWILSTLQAGYLWNNDVKKVKTPDMSLGYKEFLKTLLTEANGSDKDGTMDGGWEILPDGMKERYLYSWVDEAPTYTRTAIDEFNQPTFGFDYVAWWVAGNTKIACFVTWVREDSPAYKAGLRRGMWIDKYNGHSMATESEYSQFGEAFFYDVAEGSSLDVGTDQGLSMTITAEVMELNPLIVPPKVIDVGDKKVGYLVYNDFESGPSDGMDGRTPLYKFDNALRNAFATTFKGVDELVLDLRYNPGGYVSSCEILCALISGADSPDIFAKLAYNNRDSETNPSENLCEIYKYKKEANALTNLSRVFVLETDASASASEMVISSLRGIKGEDWVVHIGETTEGKNVGMNTYKETIGGVDYEMTPITFKIHNAKGFADYANGFTPTYPVVDYDPRWYASTGGYELGDPREPLLKKALDIIAGSDTRAPQSIQSLDRSTMIPRREKPRGGFILRESE
jgi:hypothetical protein